MYITTSSKILFKNDKTFPVKTLYREHKPINGILRDTLRFVFDPAQVDYAAVKSYFENGELMDEFTYVETVENTESETAQVSEEKYLYRHFSVFNSIQDVNEIVVPETASGMAKYERHLIVEVSQKLYSDIQMEELQKKVDIFSELLVDSIGGAI